MCQFCSTIFIIRPVSAVRPSSATDDLRGRYHNISGYGRLPLTSAITPVYSSVGSKLSVRPFLFSRLAVLGGGLFCTASCNSGFVWFLIVMCNIVYDMASVVAASVMFVTYQGASMISLKTRF